MGNNLTFSQREGIELVRTQLQIDDMDTPLRNGLWNVFFEFVWKITYFSFEDNCWDNDNVYPLFKCYWRDFFHSPVDTLPRFCDIAYEEVRKRY